MGEQGVGERAVASLILPAYNENAVIASSLERVQTVLLQDLSAYSWEIVVVDDGSTDGTADRVRATAERLQVPVQLVIHHVNAGLGGALRTGFALARGVVVVVLDSDLSYAPTTAVDLVRAWEQTRAHVVIASPYSVGGRTVGVPPALERRSRIANRLLSRAALDDIRTLTGMVRAYDGAFLRALSLKAVDVDINVEILYKTQLVRGTIVEIPAVLDWSGLAERAARGAVLSSRSRWNTAKSLVMSYLFRPFWFPLAPALVTAPIALALIAWGRLGWQGLAIACLVLTVQLVTSSLSMLQSKRYFEELFTQAARGRAGPVDLVHPRDVEQLPTR